MNPQADRFDKTELFKVCTDGLPKHSVIAVGTPGTLKNKTDRNIFFKGLEVVVKRLMQTAIIVYGACPDSIFQKYRDMGIEIYHFESDLGKAMGSRKEVI